MSDPKGDPAEKIAAETMQGMAEMLGATGEFPDGKVSPDDEGELRLAAGVDRDFNVRIDFGKPVTWLSMPAEQAEEFANMLLQQAHWAMEHRGK